MEFPVQNSTYNKYLRPATDSSTQTEINLQFSVIAIADFNVVEETITTTTILKLSWNEEFITWQPESFGTLTRIHVTCLNTLSGNHTYKTLENSVLKLGELGTPSLMIYWTITVTSYGKTVEVFSVSF